MALACINEESRNGTHAALKENYPAPVFHMSKLLEKDFKLISTLNFLLHNQIDLYVYFCMSLLCFETFYRQIRLKVKPIETLLN